MKHCRKCGADKADTEFYAGHVCKACKCAYTQAYYAANADRLRAAARARQRGRKVAYSPERRKAWQTLNNAIAAGKVWRQRCEDCGKYPAQAHHEDYTKPFVMDWLCAQCHKKHHRKYA